MIYPPDSLCKWLPEEERWETMEELAVNLERERNGLPPRSKRHLSDAKEAARIERYMKRGPVVVVPKLEVSLTSPPVPKNPAATEPTSLLDQIVDEFRQKLVHAVMEAHAGNQTVAAKFLGVHRNTVNRIARAR